MTDVGARAGGGWLKAAGPRSGSDPQPLAAAGGAPGLLAPGPAARLEVEL